MGLKGYRLWVMGQLDSNVQRPTEFLQRDGGVEAHEAGRARDVAVKVAFVLKPGNHLIGSIKVETKRFQARWVNWIRLALPHRDEHRHLARGVALQVAFERQTLKPDFSLDWL